MAVVCCIAVAEEVPCEGRLWVGLGLSMFPTAAIGADSRVLGSPRRLGGHRKTNTELRHVLGFAGSAQPTGCFPLKRKSRQILGLRLFSMAKHVD